MTTTKIPKQSLAQQLKTLKSMVSQTDLMEAKLQRQRTEMYIRTYNYVNQLQREERVKTQTEGIQTLVDSVKKSHALISQWYSFGKYIHDKKLTVSAGAGSVQIAASRGSCCTNATQLKIVQAIKDCKRPKDIVKLISNDPQYRTKAAQRKAKKLEKNKHLSAKRIKMEMLSVLTLAMHKYGEGLTLELYQGDSDEPILSVG